MYIDTLKDKKEELESLKNDLKLNMLKFVINLYFISYGGIIGIDTIVKSILDNHFVIPGALLGSLINAFLADRNLDEIKSYMSEYNALKLEMNKYEVMKIK